MAKKHKWAIKILQLKLAEEKEYAKRHKMILKMHEKNHSTNKELIKFRKKLYEEHLAIALDIDAAIYVLKNHK